MTPIRRTLSGTFGSRGILGVRTPERGWAVAASAAREAAAAERGRATLPGPAAAGAHPAGTGSSPGTAAAAAAAHRHSNGGEHLMMDGLYAVGKEFDAVEQVKMGRRLSLM